MWRIDISKIRRSGWCLEASRRTIEGVGIDGAAVQYEPGATMIDCDSRQGDEMLCLIGLKVVKEASSSTGSGM